MEPIPDILSAEALHASQMAVHAQKDAAQAVETARAQQQVALNESTTQSLVSALKEVFGENEKAQRFVDVTRIPLICKSIFDIHENIKEIKGAITTENSDYEMRLRVIERNQWKWIGVITVLTPVFTIVLGLVLRLMFG